MRRSLQLATRPRLVMPKRPPRAKPPVQVKPPQLPMASQSLLLPRTGLPRLPPVEPSLGPLRTERLSRALEVARCCCTQRSNRWHRPQTPVPRGCVEKGPFAAQRRPERKHAPEIRDRGA